MLTHYDAVVIDDDALVRMMWSQCAKRAGKSLAVYESFGAFWKARASIALETPIYIDSHLGGGVLGEQEAKTMSEAGHSEIHLMTGYEASLFKDMPWLRSIVGKDPIWI